MRGTRAKLIRKYVDSVDLSGEDNSTEDTIKVFKKMYARKLRKMWNRGIDRDIISMLTEGI